MSLNTFTPQVDIGVVGGNVPVFTDPKCTQRASLFDAATGTVPLKGNALVVPEGAIPPAFQCSASTVYFKAGSGAVISLTSAGVSAATRTDGVTPLNLALKVTGI